ncbi:T9SS type A sorting domain-containing protein [Candidatus Chrysopegis kryptomonas]|uniref:Por secretion system C-terminal sorting domain-containing protein n=1 Tax=Candidatus Chryseopegocella kryptomonas TaxID=1633643 RepID=A0A0P1MMQ7_9BACT|nr:T9SS type A sorting domain-containing protein [Candidatus Chrysopegis kryptomonas]CUS97018.1 Por secretion system C-terminal sorting domain-containing protein [Candidatus Chrysopegis kryptomonas]
MKEKIFSFLTALALIFNFSFSQVPTLGNEFPIETSSDSTIALSGAYDSQKYLIVLRKELSTGEAEIIAQFHSKIDNSLIRNPIVLGRTKITKQNFDYGIPQCAFDGDRFLVVWTDGENGGIKYRFINAQTFELSNLYSDSTYPCYLGGVSTLHFNPNLNKYFLVSIIKTSSRANYLTGVFIRPDGFMENSFQISNIPSRKEFSVAYGNSKYLVCFTNDDNDFEVWGQILSENGSAIGPSFLIDGTSAPSDNPLFVVYDGTKFICLFPDEEATGWKIYARFVNPNGTVPNPKQLVTSNAWVLPFAFVNNDEILFACTSFGNNPGVIGRFFDLSLNPKSDEFVIFEPSNGKTPMGNFIVHANDKYIVFTTRVEFAFTPDSEFYPINGNVYGRTISPITSVVIHDEKAFKFDLSQNYPNPFNPETNITFSVPFKTNAKIEIFDLSGKKINTVVDDVFEAGTHTIKFKANGLPSGVYIYRIQAGDFSSARKMILIK